VQTPLASDDGVELSQSGEDEEDGGDSDGSLEIVEGEDPETTSDGEVFIDGEVEEMNEQ
jgi:hypothetical protein